MRWRTTGKNSAPRGAEPDRLRFLHEFVSHLTALVIVPPLVVDQVLRQRHGMLASSTSEFGGPVHPQGVRDPSAPLILDRAASRHGCRRDDPDAQLDECLVLLRMRVQPG